MFRAPILFGKRDFNVTSLDSTGQRSELVKWITESDLPDSDPNSVTYYLCIQG